MEEEGPTTCKILKDPLSISDLMGEGTNFEINTDFEEGFAGDVFDDINFGSDNEDDKIDASSEQLISPWTRPFSELKEQMVKVNEHIYKKIIEEGDRSTGPVPLKARVCIRYNAYWEGEGAPFDSSYLRGFSHRFYTGQNEVLEGLEAAVRTMHSGEQSQFIISYHLLFREMGCPPRIKPRADGLFIIEVIRYTEVGEIDADLNLSEEERRKFAVVITKVKDIHLKALDFFGQGMYKNACRAFERAVELLSFCNLSSEEEEREQQAFLLKLYTNLAVAHIKVNAPARACIFCKEIRRITNNNPSCKALFQEGRAHFMLGNYEKARSMLKSAQNMEPQNLEISKELRRLEDRFSNYKKNEKKIWSKAMGVISNADTKKDAPLEDLFEKEMIDVIKSFKEDNTATKFNLPVGLSKAEILTVEQLAKSMELFVVKSPLDADSISIIKAKRQAPISSHRE